MSAIADPHWSDAQPVASDAPAISQAQLRFNEGLALLRAGKFAEACPKLEESVQLEPAAGSKFRLGECYEGLGRLAAAYRVFREVEGDTRVEARTDREAQVRAKLTELEPRLAWLIVRAPEQVRLLDGFALEQDGQPLSAEDLRAVRIPTDPGEHVFVASATDHVSARMVLVTSANAPTELQIPLLVRALTQPPIAQPSLSPQLPPPPLPENTPLDTGLSAGRVTAIVLFGLGAAGVGLGATFAIVAKVQWDDAQAGCVAGAFNRCSTQAIEVGEQANGSAVAATALIIAGAASLAGGLGFWLAFPGDPASPALSVSFQPPTHGLGTIARAEWTWP